MACKIKTRYFPKTQTAVEREITDLTKKLVEEVLQVALFGKCKKKKSYLLILTFIFKVGILSKQIFCLLL